MSRGKGKNNNSMGVISVVLGLAALGAGLGATIASRFVTYRPIPNDSAAVEVAANPDVAVSSNNSQAFCQYNALDSVTASLYQVRAINAIANDPLPTLTSWGSSINADLIANFNPAPFPQISDRARAAKIPIIMYHDIAATKDVSWDVTTDELERHFQALQEGGYTPISMDQMVNHLRTGSQLPENLYYSPLTIIILGSINMLFHY